MRHGEMTEEEAAVHPQRHILTRALGVSAEVEADMWELALDTGDRVLLCSDGLTNEVGADEIKDILRRVDDPGEAAERLVESANQHSGADNITVVVVDVQVGEQGDGASSKVTPLALGVAAAAVPAAAAAVAVVEPTAGAPARPPSSPEGLELSDETAVAPAVGRDEPLRRVPASCSATSRPRWPRRGRAATSSSWAPPPRCRSPDRPPGVHQSHRRNAEKPPGKEGRARAPAAAWGSPPHHAAGRRIHPPGGRGARRRLLRAQVVRVRQLDRDRAG